MLQNMEINTLTGSISAKESHPCLQYSMYDGVVRRVSINNVRIESVGSAGQTGFTYQALV